MPPGVRSCAGRFFYILTQLNTSANVLVNTNETHHYMQTRPFYKRVLKAIAPIFYHENSHDQSNASTVKSIPLSDPEPAVVTIKRKRRKVRIPPTASSRDPRFNHALRRILKKQ